MKRCDSATVAALCNRWFLYSFFGRLFAAEPDGDLLDLVEGDHLAEECSMLDAADRQVGKILCFRARGSVLDRETDLEALVGEYTKLMIGPGKVPAPPWESIYVSREPLLFQESTLEVREAYAAAGFEAAGYPREADDHLATELNFMAALADRAVRAYESEDIEVYENALRAQSRFLKNHLLVWVGEFSDRMNDVDGISSFYPSFASLAALVCERDAGVIEELLAEL